VPGLCAFGFCPKDISTAWTMLAFPVDENITLRASLLAQFISAAHPDLFCLVSVTGSLAGHFTKVRKYIIK